MTVCGIQQRACGTDLDAVATLGAVEPTEICANDRVSPASTCLDCFFPHPFIADSRAAFTEDASLRIVSDHRREVSLGVVVFLLGEPLFHAATVECQLLQFTLAAAVTHWTIKRVIGEQEFSHTSLRLLDLFALSGDNHSIRAGDGAGSLQFRHFLNAHETHAAGSLQGKVCVVAERRDVETLFAADV